MRLVDLEPRWLTPNLFIFKCPHCVRVGGEKRVAWLSCKDVAMPTDEQWNLFEEQAKAEGGGYWVTPSRGEFAWNFSTRDFATITVTPSIDASPSGCWHGFIQNGVVT